MKLKLAAKIITGFLFLWGTQAVSAQFKLPSLFTDHMLLQRDQPIHVWGWGQPRDTVEITFDGETQTVVVKPDTSWDIYLKPRRASSTGQSLRIRHGGGQYTLEDILIGDVWLCLGQSNMEWPLWKEMHYSDEVIKTDQRLLRFYNPTYAGKNVYNETFGDSIINRLEADRFYQGQWEVSNPETAKDMSAVGYYFGQMILNEVSVPVGLVNLAIGGAPLETFVGVATWSASKEHQGKVAGNWLYNNELPVWVRERGMRNLKRAKHVPMDGSGPNHPYKPGFAFEAGVRPMFDLSIRGIIWYQGESNAQEVERVHEYTALQRLMVEEYRKGWGNPQLPFYWVQLSSIDTTNYKGHLWPEFRDGQRRLLSMVSHGGMAITSDIGAKNDVHPTNKKDVGERLARWALHGAYGRTIVPSGPLVKSVVFKKDRLIVAFEHGKGLASSDGKALRGFSLDGHHPVPAEIWDGKVIVPVQDRPKFLYYGWQAWTMGNLVNSDRLPASTFRMPLTYDR
ncbi:MAG: sialate O-acetylesterase [Muricauda sp.]|nr:sialate O-acetylesterase [Allomuricauda sp.]